MPNLNQIQARLRAEIDRMVAARMQAPAGPRLDPELAAVALAAEIAPRLTQNAPPNAAQETPSTPTQPRQDEEAMPVLTDEIKTFIVNGLACYDTPTQVAEGVRVNFEITVSRQQIHEYDPACSRPPAQRWRELHAAAREAYLREVAQIGVAQKAVRLAMLDRMAHHAMRNHYVTNAAKFLEQAAKECGGIYENRRSPAQQVPIPQPTPPAPPPEAPSPKPPVPQPAPREVPAPEVAAPKPAAAPPVLRAPSPPEHIPPQATPPQPTPPQPTPSQSPTPSLSAPQPVMPQPLMAQPDKPAHSAPQPLSVLAQPPQSPASPEGRPLNREERFLAYVRDRHARDRAVAAQAILDSKGISAAPPASQT